MGVSLPSDLIVDVMRGADPARLERATTKLRSLDASPDEPRAFADMLGGVEATKAAPRPTAARAIEDKAYVDFERMVLRNMFETLLPAETSGAFGSGPSAGIWRSLAADQLAGLYAGTGGIGIASTLAAGEVSPETPSERQWPYFTSVEIKAYAG